MPLGTHQIHQVGKRHSYLHRHDIGARHHHVVSGDIVKLQDIADQGSGVVVDFRRSGILFVDDFLKGFPQWAFTFPQSEEAAQTQPSFA